MIPRLAGFLPSNSLRRFQALLALSGGLDVGSLTGLGTANGTDTANDIDIAAGIARDSANGVNLELTATKTIAIDAAGANGLFTGTVAADTYYHMFTIKKDSDGTIDAGFDTSVIAANIPSGYTEFRRLGTVFTDSSAEILQYYQSDDLFMWDDLTNATTPLDLDSTGVGTTASSVALTVAPDVEVDAIVHVYADEATTNEIKLSISSLLVADKAPSESVWPLHSGRVDIHGGSPNEAIFRGVYRTNTSRQIRVDGSGAWDRVRIAAVGYYDSRGRYG